MDRYVAHKLFKTLGDQGLDLFEPLVKYAKQKTMNTAMGSYQYFDFSSNRPFFMKKLHDFTTLSPTGIDTIVQFLMHSDDPSAMLAAFTQPLPAEPMKGVSIETSEQKLKAISSLSMIQNPVASMCFYLEGLAINKGFDFPPRSISKKRRLQQLTHLLSLRISMGDKDTTKLLR